MLKHILKKYGAMGSTGTIPFRRGSTSWLFKHGNEVGNEVGTTSLPCFKALSCPSAEIIEGKLSPITRDHD